MSCVIDEKDRKLIEEQAATIRLLSDLTKAGSVKNEPGKNCGFYMA